MLFKRSASVFAAGCFSLNLGIVSVEGGLLA